VIDISDPMPEIEVIPRLLASPVLQRLRRVKQLDFASQTYPAADHSRYAHALGTMHVMRLILSRLFRVHGGLDDIIQALQLAYPEVFSTDAEHARQALAEHMLVAALLQDLGELPYAHATKYVYQPSSSLREAVARSTGLDVTRLSGKTIFTLGIIQSEILENTLGRLHMPLLLRLVANQGDQLPVANVLGPLFHILDGTVDADRLDYVFRDAHHTVGGFGSPSSVIETILYYDDDGPVVSEPGPVANLLATRAYLYSTVYHSPSNRFRIHVLLTLLRGVLRDTECARTFFGSSGAELSIEDLLDLDDVSVASRITELANSTLKRRLDTRTRNALDILNGRHTDYEFFWLPPGKPPATNRRPLDLPDEVFFDTFRDQEGPIYQPGSVRVVADSLRFVGAELPLEACGGPFSALFLNYWSMVPMRDSILIFLPRRRRSAAIDSFAAARDEGWLYDVLLDEDPLGPVDFATDTRDSKGYIGPAIFISFSWRDLNIVKNIACELAARKRRYYLYAGPFQGISGTAADNSIKAVREADAILVIASINYANRFRDEPDGYISREIFGMSNRVAQDSLPIGVLGVDNSRELRDGLPWSALGFSEVPFMGVPLRDAPPRVIRDAVAEVLNAIDQKLKAAT